MILQSLSLTGSGRLRILHQMKELYLSIGPLAFRWKYVLKT
nr:MAG TPA: hypothetical protein [Caudoviricetes sp.]